jgi:CheY-like chemotaxis protein
MKRKILIIEDQREIALVLQEYLEDEGLAAAVALNGREAIDKCRSEPFDLLVTDLKLPDIDGRAVVETCRHWLPNLKVLFVTGYVSDLNVKTGSNCQVLKKPCKPAKILEAIKNMLK